MAGTVEAYLPRAQRAAGGGGDNEGRRTGGAPAVACRRTDEDRWLCGKSGLIGLESPVRDEGRTCGRGDNWSFSIVVRRGHRGNQAIGCCLQTER